MVCGCLVDFESVVDAQMAVLWSRHACQFAARDGA